jgi:hypothetical protein
VNLELFFWFLEIYPPAYPPHFTYFLTSAISHVSKHRFCSLPKKLDVKLRWKVHVKKKREELGLKYKHMNWLIGRSVGLVNTQAGALHTDIEACVDLWHTAVGMHETEQHSHNTEISKLSTREHSYSTLVRSER